MISHSPGTPGVQKPPPERQLDASGVTTGFQIDEAVFGQPVQMLQPREGRLGRRSGIGRIQKHDVEPSTARWAPGGRIGANDFNVVRAEGVGRALQRGGDRWPALDHDHRLRAARCRLEPERSGSGKEIETARAFHVATQPVEQGLPHSIRCRADLLRLRHRQPPAAPAPGDDAHRASGCRALHVDGGRAEAHPDRLRCIRARATIIEPLPIQSSTRIPFQEILARRRLSEMDCGFIISDRSAEDV